MPTPDGEAGGGRVVLWQVGAVRAEEDLSGEQLSDEDACANNRS